MLKTMNIKKRHCISMNDNFMPGVEINDETRICLECTASKCRGACERYREEIKKLKNKKKEK